MITLEQVQELLEKENRWQELANRVNDLKAQYRVESKAGKGLITRELNQLEPTLTALGKEVFDGEVPQPESPERALPKLLEWMEKIKVDYGQLKEAVLQGMAKNVRYATSYKLSDLIKAESKWYEIESAYDALVEIADPYDKVQAYFEFYANLMDRWQENIIDNARNATRLNGSLSGAVENIEREAIGDLVYHFKGRWGRYADRQARIRDQVEVWKVMKDNGLLEESTNG